MNTTSTLLVTGAAGFIGARFVESCHWEGKKVISVDRLDYFKSRQEHQRVPFGMCVDRDELFDFLKTNSPPLEAIVHLGACADTTVTDEAYLNRVNVEYTQNLWNYACEKQIPFVYASSAATYGLAEPGEKSIDDESQISTLKPLNAYGRSKQKVDEWILDQEKNKKITPPTWAGFKFFNVYGFGERHKKKMASVVFHAFEQLRQNGKVKLFESHRPDIAHGHQKRDFIFVEDVIRVLHFALKKPIPRGIFNLGTGQARTFLDLVGAVFKTVQFKESIEFIPTPIELRDKYQYFTEASMDRLRAEGYKTPFLSIEEGVKQYVLQLQADARERLGS